MRRLFVLSVLLLGSGTAYATTWDDIVDQAFEAMVDDMGEKLAFTETRRSTDRSSVARHDPRLPDGQRWVLRSIDDRDPSEDEVQEFLEQKEKNRESESNEDDDGIGSIVAEGSLELVEETDAHWQFSFKPAAESDEERAFMEFVDGTLQVTKDGHYVSEIQLQNSKPIKPGKGVKIQEFQTTMVFAPIAEGGPTAPQRIRTRVKGRAMLVIGIDETEVIEYSDFEVAGE